MGGLDDSNLSSFLLTKKGSNVFVSLDAGTIWSGVSKLIAGRSLSPFINITYPAWAIQNDQKVSWFIRNYILGYFIGHSHLDHIQGLIEVSPEDYLPTSVLESKPPIESGILGLVRGLLEGSISTPNGGSQTISKKAIVGFPFTLSAIQNNLFNNVIWPNLPNFGRYDYFQLEKNVPKNLADLIFLNDTQKASLSGQFPNNMALTAFETCHNDILSTAFLFTDKLSGDQIVFFSDTGIPSQPTPSSLFGHLRPKDVMGLMPSLLAKSIQPPKPSEQVNNLEKVKLIVQHIKPNANQLNSRLSIRQLIFKELMEDNPLGIKVIIPQQGEPICL
eukprot:gene19517-23380_t